MQRRPVCFYCASVVDYDPIFAAPCDHEDCASAVFHGVCLMDWRDHRQEVFQRVQRWFQEHADRSESGE